jgi:hypothetical protein
MKLNKNNLLKPSNVKFKLIADIGLYSLALLNPMIMATNFSDNAAKWILFGLNMMVVIFKTLSKFSADENINTDN